MRMFRRVSLFAVALLATSFTGCNKGGGGGAADTSTPKSAAKSVMSGIIDGDAEKALAACYTTNDKQKQTIQTLADLMKSANKFEQAVKAKLPDVAKEMGDQNERRPQRDEPVAQGSRRGHRKNPR